MQSLKIATWNVNSLRVRLPHVLAWLAKVQPDVLSLQETKVTDANFPLAEIQAAGYRAVFSGQNAYNGVAVLSKNSGHDVVLSLPGLDCEQKRVLAITIGNVRIVNLYIPNGQSLASAKFVYKMSWLHALKDFLAQEVKEHPHVLVMGDFNIAPTDEDIYNPLAWEGEVLCSPAERDLFNELLALGFKDCFRLQAQPKNSFSWWDYRMDAFSQNKGLRIDHILATHALAESCIRCGIDKAPRGLDRPSDHTPVFADFLT